MQLIPIETEAFSNRDSVRKAREAFLISKGRTLLPHGLSFCFNIYIFVIVASIFCTYQFFITILFPVSFIYCQSI